MSKFVVKYNAGIYDNSMEIISKSKTSAKRMFTNYANKIGADFPIISVEELPSAYGYDEKE